MAQFHWLIHQESGSERPKKPQSKSAIYLQKSDGVVGSSCLRNGEMPDLLRIGDDGAAGRRGGHLRINEGFNGAERGRYAT